MDISVISINDLNGCVRGRVVQWLACLLPAEMVAGSSPAVLLYFETLFGLVLSINKFFFLFLFCCFMNMSNDS